MVSAPTRLQPLQQVRLSGISWATYLRRQNEQDNRKHYQGCLHIMAPSSKHEYLQ